MTLKLRDAGVLRCRLTALFIVHQNLSLPACSSSCIMIIFSKKIHIYTFTWKWNLFPPLLWLRESMSNSEYLRSSKKKRTQIYTNNFSASYSVATTSCGSPLLIAMIAASSLGWPYSRISLPSGLNTWMEDDALTWTLLLPSTAKSFHTFQVLYKNSDTIG